MKCIILSAPSGAGKTTIAQALLHDIPELSFSVSATSREQRPNEIYGKDYYFLSLDDFKRKIEKEEFVEWEEVYEDVFYGTLKSEMERIKKAGKHPVFDVDVKGGIKLKKIFGEDALSIFIHPGSVQVLEERLRKRGTETEEKLKKRLGKAEQELGYAKEFDIIVVNEELTHAIHQCEEVVEDFLKL